MLESIVLVVVLALALVWNYFDLDESKGKVACRKCKQELCYNRSTSAMREHIKRKHVHIDMMKKESDW